MTFTLEGFSTGSNRGELALGGLGVPDTAGDGCETGESAKLKIGKKD
ncbi:MAG: hypothetical protein JNK09_18695 [Prolixibacteraceae bacterium]|nr:hypothetical protein [Prolixibacteraceae bacterium]